MSDVYNKAEFTDRGGGRSVPEDATMALHTEDSNGESNSSDHDAVSMTRTAEAVHGLEDEDSDESPQNRSKKRVNKLIDSDSETEGHNSPTNNEGKVKSPRPTTKPRDSANHSLNLANKLLDSFITSTSNKGKIKSTVNSSDTSSDESMSNTVPRKSRIKRINSSDSGSDSGSIRSLTIEQSDNSNEKTSPKTKKVANKLPNSDSSNSDSEIRPSKYEEQKARMKEKRSNLQQKFQSLVTSRRKETPANDNESKKGSSSGSEQVDKSESGNSNDEAASIERIKQKIKERTVHLKSTIYDPDTSSDEETAGLKHVQKQKKPRKSNKPTSTKPVRMSAKQAMENMQKIKSESNRMLREKEVSLPYHRPKALSLKDIMSKRRPALTADGKSLPIKMSEEQLKLYAQSLEQRQKEVIELCKSDTDEECDYIQAATEIESKDNVENEDRTENLDKNATDSKTDPQAEIDMTAQNNTLFDTLADETNKSILNDMNVTSEDQNISKTKDIENNTEKQNYTKIPSNIVDEGSINDRTGKSNDEKCTETEKTLVYNDSIENMDTSVGKLKEFGDKPNILESDLNIVEDQPNNLESKEPNFEVIESKQLQNTDSVHLNSNIIGTEVDSQLIHLHYDDTEPLQEKLESQNKDISSKEYCESPQDRDIERPKTDKNAVGEIEDKELCNYETGELMETDELNKNEEDGNDIDFLDDDIDMADIDDLIENAEIISNQINDQNFDSPMLIKDPKSNTNPKLTGAPGMIIDLDGTDPTHRKLTGVQLLKERFSYFSKLKTAEEMERDREKKLKPGNKRQILKQELEDQIAEQRSLEWANRLETENQLHKELELNDEKGSDEEDIDKIEAKLEESEVGEIQKEEERESSGESEPEENDCDMSDKPAKRNPMLADEAEESDCDEEIPITDENLDQFKDRNDEDNEEDDTEEEESSESEEEEEQATNNPKKRRILIAFEDSDEEGDKQEVAKADTVSNEIKAAQSNRDAKESVAIKNTQDDDLQLAQHVKSQSEDLFVRQESTLGAEIVPAHTETSINETNLGTQTFSIAPDAFKMPDKLSICDSQLSQDGNLDAVVGMCSGSFSQAIPVSQFPSQLPESQVIGDDVLALCTGKFYDNPFVSQNDEKLKNDEIDKDKPLYDNDPIQIIKVGGTQPTEIEEKIRKENEETEKYNETQDVTIELTDLKDTRPITESMDLNNTNTTEPIPKDDILESILDELNEPEKKPNKYFIGNIDKENELNEANFQYKKKFVIDSDEEVQGEETGQRKKKLKKRKLEKRALQISDDESEQSDEEVEDEEYASEIDEENEEKLVEYDSDENEVEMVPKMKIPKKKKKAPEFFEQEAELTSEDEWIGSGDEDEAGLDRMEREEGDDDKFNQRQLQRELGQIHMRDVLDQDKREVRIIQELLFEDGDLGTGSRQRKFRWKNAEGDEETGTVVDALPDTQEEEFESEEQWRKQRHEREMFLREMKKQNESEDLLDMNMTVDQTSIMSSVTKSTSLVQDATIESTTVDIEKTTAKDVPSPKKSAFILFKQNYHSSLLTRGQGALARLAAIATPLAADEDAPKVGSVAGRKRNFVFATLTQEEVPKVTKRKAETNTGTPRLVKKLRTEDKPKHSQNSLLDHMKA